MKKRRRRRKVEKKKEEKLKKEAKKCHISHIGMSQLNTIRANSLISFDTEKAITILKNDLY